MQNGSVSRTSRRTLACTLLSDKSHGALVVGSLVAKSKLHPGFKLIPSNFVAVASWHILGLE